MSKEREAAQVKHQEHVGGLFRPPAKTPVPMVEAGLFDST
jgi:hypothetical protein